MPCYHPHQVYRISDGNHVHQSGKPKIYFGDAENPSTLRQFGQYMDLFPLPCGKCVGCLLRRAADWAIRCTHEARYHTRKAFLTLTYDREHLPKDRSLQKRHLILFFKRLRHYAQGPIKYFACGEYGDRRGRPHYHAIVFGHDFPDEQPVPNNEGAEYPLYESETLNAIWFKGAAKIGRVTDKSADYVARYTIKKIHKQKHYGPSGMAEPFCLMSKGIGKSYYKEFKTDIYPSDYIIHEDTKQKRTVPRYYDKQLEKDDPDAFAALKLQRRKLLTPEREHDFTANRLAVREESRLLKIKALTRNYDSA